jgi:oligosaccharide reducing-end xylanase
MKRIRFGLSMLFVFAAALIGCGNGSPDTGAAGQPVLWDSGDYKNLFVTLSSKTDAEVQTKLGEMADHFFSGTDTIYYTDSNGGYIKDIVNNDIRSEGMSYGMIVALQLDGIPLPAGSSLGATFPGKAIFDNIWKWAKARMDSNNDGLFEWQCSTGGSCSGGSAPDGEEYFAMALYLADKKWGGNPAGSNTSYKSSADQIAGAMLNSLWNGNLVRFVPGSSLTDPSYNVPAFYELWSRWNTANASRWTAIRDASRTLLKNATNRSNGLAPNYSDTNGGTNGVSSPNNVFFYDAWRVAMNIAVDYYWWGGGSWEQTQADAIQAFFESKGLTTYGCLFNLDGSRFNYDKTDMHRAGLMAMNAVASLAATDQVRAKKFVDELWNVEMPSGTERYYDGCLYMLAMLHVSGQFKIWGSPGATTYTLTLHANGGGGPVIYSDDSGVACGGPSTPCTFSLPQGTTVNLQALCINHGDAGWRGWTGCSPSSDGCSVTMDGDKTVSIMCAACEFVPVCDEQANECNVIKICEDD